MIRLFLFLLCFIFQNPLFAHPQITDSTDAEHFQHLGDQFFRQSAFDSSIAYFSLARNLFEKTENWEGFMQCSNSMADILVRKAQYERGLECLQNSLIAAQERLGPDHIALGQTHNLLGYILFYRQDYGSAVTHLKEALRIRTRTRGENHPEVGYTCYTLALAYRAMGNYDEALTAANRALKISKAGDINSDVAMNLVALANIHSDQGDYEKAVSMSGKANDILSRLGKKDSELAAACNFALARDLIKKNQFAKALSHLKLSLATYKHLFGEDHPAVSACYMKFGEIYSLRGDYDEAIVYYERAGAIMIRVNGEHHSGLAELYSFLSDLYSNKHDSGKALGFAERSLQIQVQNYGDEHLSTARSLLHLAQVYERNENWNAALKQYERSLKIHLKFAGQDNILVARLFLFIGAVFTKANAFDSARIYLKKSYESYAKSGAGDSMFLASWHKSYGDMFYRKGEISAALEQYQRAVNDIAGNTANVPSDNIPVTDDQNAGDLLLECLVAKAKSLEALYKASNDLRDIEAAFSLYEGAMTHISIIRRGYRAGGSRAFFGERSHRIYTDAIRAALMIFVRTKDASFKEKAFYAVERSKANLLHDDMVEADAINFSGAPDSILERETSLKADLAFCEGQIQKTNKAEQPVKFRNDQDKYFALSAEYNGLLDTLESQYPRYFELKYKDTPVKVKDIQQALDPNTSLVEYCFVDSVLCIFTISNSSFDVTIAPNASKIIETAIRLRKSLRSVNDSQYLRTSALLYRMIVQPVKRYLKAKHLLIIPDGELYYIPFEALLTGSPKTYNPADYSILPYLIRKYSVSYCYSTSLSLIQNQRNTVRREYSFAGFAPVFSDSAKNNLVLPPGSVEEKPIEVFANVRSISIDGKKYNELPYTKTEIDGIARLFDGKHLKYTTRLFEDANKASFKQIIHGYSCVHIASHSYADDEHPDQSGILFSPTKDTLTRDDGIMNARETYALKMEAELVVLSSCESGMGKLVKGEGLMALTRGFFYSGARNIVFSLWKVPDKHTSDLMTAFYGFLLSGVDMPSAMRKAKLKMINDPLSAFPSKWTGFVLLSFN